MRRWITALLAGAGVCLVAVLIGGPARPEGPAATPATAYTAKVRPLLQRNCLGCHSTKGKKGGLDLERFGTLEAARKDLKVWVRVIEQLEAGEMPPKGKPQPTAEERRRIVSWARSFLDAEARARAGDPGHVPLRRLSNAEYDYTVRDLTGVDLRPAREFPADGAGGEGFTNAAESLSDISPALLDKYLAAAREIAAHAVLLPDGIRFSPTKTRRDWTDESLARLREFYRPFIADGRLPLQPYLAATVRHRDALLAGRITLAAVANREKLNPKYFGILWRALADSEPSYPLDALRARWRTATEKDVGGQLADVAAWQAVLWQIVPIGSYRYGNTVRQVANDPVAVETQTLRMNVKPVPGQAEVWLYLSGRDLVSADKAGPVVWNRPRLEGAGKQPLLLRDYAEFGPKYEIDFAAVFADSAKYLALIGQTALDRKASVIDSARAAGLDPVLAKRWAEVAGFVADADPEFPGRPVPTDAIVPLDEKVEKVSGKPAVHGWRKKGTDLPSLVTNASDATEQIPGRVSPHGVAVHPTPTEYVAAVWKSPAAGRVRVTAKVAHAHPACGNGVAWWLEHRRGDRAGVLADGAVDLGGEAEPTPRTLNVAKGDLLILAVDARNRDHVCDLTEIRFTVTEVDKPGRTWDLAADVAGTVLDGNPHADKLGQKDVWSFVRGPARPTGAGSGTTIPAGSLLGQWREAAIEPARRAETDKLAGRVQALLTGTRPAAEKHPDRILFDNFVSTNSALLRGLDLSGFGKKPAVTRYGLPKERFDKEGNLVVPADVVVEVRLPAALFHDREFVVDAKPDLPAADRAFLFQVTTSPPLPVARWDGKTPIVAARGRAAHQTLVRGFADFRRVFPVFICYPHVIPVDEVVCLKMYHREDEPLVRLFLTDNEHRRIDRLWAEHRFISQQPIAENDYLPQFIQYVTQDQPKELLAYFESQRGPFRNRAQEFERDLAAAVPIQLDALLDFAARAYRRPLGDAERAQLLALYDGFKKKGMPHEETFRNVLARVLVAPAFLFRLEQPPPGKAPGRVSDWELAARLSYFLWSSCPDDELRRVAAAGRLRDPAVLSGQALRMLKDDKARALAVEFGCQWLHVRGFDRFNEKNEKLFPTFDANLRSAIYEETVFFFLDLFREDRSVSAILDADYTFLNETLAKHYGIPGVTGSQWRRVEAVRKYGRGGILGLASILAKESGASRTSPVLRGNWVVETLLGEKLPRPPPNVPRLPDDESEAVQTVRQLVEKHTRVAECAVCHERIDPFGFAFEKYDPIGRFRDKDLAGRAVDTQVKLKDGMEFDGLDGLRTYLLTKKKDAIVRLFCQRLLGFALGRATAVSDQPLIDEMVSDLDANGGRVSAAVLAIVRSPQFRMARGRDFDPDQ